MTDDDLDGVRRLGSAPPFDASTDRRVRQKVLALIDDAGEPAPEGFVAPGDEHVVLDLGERRHRGSGGRAQRWGLRAALVAAAAVIVAVVALGPLRPGADDPTFEDLGAAARTGPFVTIDDGQVLVTVTEQEVIGLWSQRSEKRVRPDGSGVDDWTALDTGATNVIEYGPGELAVGGLPYPSVLELPSSPAELERALVDQLGGDRAESITRALLELTGTTATPPATRASAFELLAERGAELRTTDDDTVLIVGAGGQRFEAAVDRRDGVVTRLEISEAGADEPFERLRYLDTSVADQ